MDTRLKKNYYGLRERPLDVHWIRYWVGPTADLDIVTKRQIAESARNRICGKLKKLYFRKQTAIQEITEGEFRRMSQNLLRLREICLNV